MALQPSRLSRWLAPLAQLVAIVFLFVNASLWLTPDLVEGVVRALPGITPDTPITVSTQLTLLGLTLSTLHVGILVYALFVIAGIFRVFARGDWFAPHIGLCLKRFGMALLLFGATAPLLRVLLVGIFTMQNPPGQRLFSIGVSANDVVLVLVGTLIFMLGYMLQEAVRMADENRQII